MTPRERKQEKLQALKKESRQLIIQIKKRIGQLKRVYRESYELKYPQPSENGEDAFFSLMDDFHRITKFYFLIADMKDGGKHVYEK